MQIERRREQDFRCGLWHKPKTLKLNYLDMYEGIHAEMMYTNRFDENSDLSTTYLGQTKLTRDTKIKAEEEISH